MKKKYSMLMQPISIKQISFFLILMTITTLSFSQGNKTTLPISDLIKNQHWTFQAETAIPMNGMSKQLSPGYDFIVSPDKIVAYLPYFGRVFISRSYNGDGGIKFTCEKYNYKLHPFKKNKWTISIQTSGMDENPSFEITVFEDGSAILDFNSNDRQPISFNGKIMATK